MEMDETITNSVNEKAEQVLTRVGNILFPLEFEQVKKLVKPHVWRDKNYVGINPKGLVSVWRGRSINLAHIDSRYRALFIDIVNNDLIASERYRLFGSAFAASIRHLKSFVVVFNLDLPLNEDNNAVSQGYIPRILPTRAHICRIYSIDEFLSLSLNEIVGTTAYMVALQRVLAIHRKPLDVLELPFQHLLKHTNFLSNFFLSRGVGVHTIIGPRKAGEFGPDFEIELFSKKSRVQSLVGVEVFMGNWGYHTDSVSKYADITNLSGLAVISKDKPPALLNTSSPNGRSIFSTQDLELLVSNKPSSFGLYHISLAEVVNQLQSIRSELDLINQIVPQ